jgi:hypothetical protein
MTQSLPEIVISDAPNPADREATLQRLAAYNKINGPPSCFQPLAILQRDPDTGETVRDLWGKTSYNWVFIELLVVPDPWRGQNVCTMLLRKATRRMVLRCLEALMTILAAQTAPS